MRLLQKKHKKNVYIDINHLIEQIGKIYVREKGEI